MQNTRLPSVKGALKSNHSMSSISSSSYSYSEKFTIKNSRASLLKVQTSKRSAFDERLSNAFGSKQSKESNIKKLKMVGVNQIDRVPVAILRFENMDEDSKAIESKPKDAADNDIRLYQERAAAEHHRLETELAMKKAGNEIRQKSLLERTALLQNTIKMFDSFIREVERKYTLARYQINRNRCEMRSLDNQKYEMLLFIKELNEIKAKRALLHIKSPVLAFMANVVAVSGFYKTPADLLNRFYVMKNNLQALMVKYEADLDFHEKLYAEQKELLRQTLFNVMYLRKHIITLKERLSVLKSENLLHSNEACHVTDEATLVDVELHTSRTAINNMAFSLMNFRPFTCRKMTKAGKHWRAQIEEIGRIMVMYKEIIDSQKQAPPHQRRASVAYEMEDAQSEAPGRVLEAVSEATVVNASTAASRSMRWSFSTGN